MATENMMEVASYKALANYSAILVGVPAALRRLRLTSPLTVRFTAKKRCLLLLSLPWCRVRKMSQT